jgi:membrane dipeptidase
MYLIIDAHEDIAWNVATFKRDYSRSAFETRAIEVGTIASKDNGDTMLGWPEYQAGNVAVVFGTLFASPARLEKFPWATQTYHHPGEANKFYHDQLDIYHRLEGNHPEKFKLITQKKDLDLIIHHWRHCSSELPDIKEPPVGIVVLMEGTEAIEKPDDLNEWWDEGVRIIGLAWHGNKYCGGTGEPGPLSLEGKQLLAVMSDVGFILDISHMDELAARQALDMYEGQVIASHANASSLIRSYQGNRHLSDDLIRHLISRGGMMGVIPLNHFLDRDWILRGGRNNVSLQMVAEQMDHICQLAGDALHVGIGTDFDGGFGLQSTPFELDSIADLQKLVPFLENLNYSTNDIAAIMGQNWQHMLEYNLP